MLIITTDTHTQTHHSIFQLCNSLYLFHLFGLNLISALSISLTNARKFAISNLNILFWFYYYYYLFVVVSVAVVLFKGKFETHRFFLQIFNQYASNNKAKVLIKFQIKMWNVSTNFIILWTMSKMPVTCWWLHLVVRPTSNSRNQSRSSFKWERMIEQTRKKQALGTTNNENDNFKKNHRDSHTVLF